MPRTRDLVALSAIFLAPLAALLLAHARAPALAPPAALAAEAAAAVVVSTASAPPAPEPVAEPVPPAPPPAVPAATAVPAPTRDPAQAMLMFKDALVLRTAAEPAWASGKLSTVAEPGHLLARRSVRWDGLPQPLHDLEATRVVVYAGDGSACVATLGAPRLQLERSGEVFSSVERDGEVYDTYEPPADRAVLSAMVKETFNHADDLLLLAAPRGEGDRACRGEWARRADLPAPIVFGRRTLALDASAALVAAVLTVVREQPEYADLRAEYETYTADIPDDARDDWPAWDAFAAAHLSVTRWDEVGGPRQIVSVALRADPEPCSGDFSGSLALLLEQQGDRLVHLPQPGLFDVTALMDLDRDGVLEAVTRSGHDHGALQAEGPNAAAVRDAFSIEFFGCPC